MSGQEWWSSSTSGCQKITRNNNRKIYAWCLIILYLTGINVEVVRVNVRLKCENQRICMCVSYVGIYDVWCYLLLPPNPQICYFLGKKSDMMPNVFLRLPIIITSFVKTYLYPRVLLFESIEGCNNLSPRNKSLLEGG